MRELLWKNKKQFTLYIIGALLTAIEEVMMQLGISVGFGLIEAQGTQEIIRRVILTLVLTLSPILIQVISRYMRIGFMRDVLVDVRLLAYRKMMKIPIEKFREKKREDYQALLVNDINIFEQDYFLSILNIFAAYGSFLIGIAIILYISPSIAGLITLASLLILAVTKLFEKPVRQNVKKNQEANAQYNEQVSNILNGLEVIKLYQVEDRFKPPFYRIVQRLERVKRRTNRLQTTQENILEWLANTLVLLIYIFATWQFIEGDIAIGSIILIYNFTGQLIWSNVNGASMINRLRGSLDIFKRITEQPTWDSGHEPYTFDDTIEIKNLNFSYGEKQVIQDLSFTIQKGEHILIYGPSGTGKTTLLNCLAQNLTTYTGEILVDGQELKTIDFESVLDHVGYARQSHFMFEASIKENIVLNRPLDEARLEEVLRSVDLWAWVETLPEKTDHLLENNGDNISGGQRQRISIARELYRDPDVLFVDEPSASLDDETSAKLYDTLMHLDKTLITVSHRHLNYLSEQVDQVIEFLPEGGYRVGAALAKAAETTSSDTREEKKL